MTQEEKQLLLKDLCARLPYGVIVHFDGWNPEKLTDIDLLTMVVNGMGRLPKPYLRPMSSMTKKERDILSSNGLRLMTDGSFNNICDITDGRWDNCYVDTESFEICIDLFNSHHLDWKGLIKKGLALEAPEGMYEIS